MTDQLGIGADTITVLRAQLVDVDRYGKQRRDWPAAAETEVTGVSVQALSAAEAAVDREYAATHLRLIAPHSIDLTATDRVRWHGLTFDVDGDPARWYDEHGQPEHLEATLKRATG